MPYNFEQTEKIRKVKIYLKEIRKLMQERFNLDLELQNVPTPQSPIFSDEPRGNNGKTKVAQLNSYVMRRDLLIKRMELFNDELNKFLPYIYLFNTGQRNIINCYINSCGYTEMIDTLWDEFLISESKYKYEISNICLQLSNYIDYNHPPLLKEINKKFTDYVSTCNQE